MEKFKTIIVWIGKVFLSIFILSLSIVWSIVVFLFKGIWDYLKKDYNTPKTKSGSWDKRFKSTRELERKRIYYVIFIAMILIVMGLIVKLL